jgi:hypothetical protein
MAPDVAVLRSSNSRTVIVSYANVARHNHPPPPARRRGTIRVRGKAAMPGRRGLLAYRFPRDAPAAVDPGARRRIP